MQAALPIKSLDQPAALGGSYKDNSEEELLRDVIDGEEVEGADDSLTARMSSRIKEDVLQHDINTVLFTLPARERNVSSPSFILAPRIFCMNADHSLFPHCCSAVLVPGAMPVGLICRCVSCREV